MYLFLCRKSAFPDFLSTTTDASRRAIAVAEDMNRTYREALIGTKQQVLFEEMHDGLYVGHAPNYMKIYVRGKDLHNEIRTVLVEKIHKDGLFATEIS